MNMAERRDKIAELVSAERSVSFSRIKKAFPDVSEMTLRTDLKYLDEQHAIIRVHGGARSVGYAVGTDDLLANRSVRNIAQKADIAAKAVSLVHPDTTIFIDSGSTTTSFAAALPDIRIMVFTNSVSVAAELARLSLPKVYVIGGALNSASMSLTGARAVENLGKLSFDQLFLGVTGYQESCGFTCGLDDEAVFKEACIEHSGETIVLMDSSKEDRRSTFPICELGDVSCVVTDGGTTDEFATACRESGVELL